MTTSKDMFQEEREKYQSTRESAFDMPGKPAPKETGLSLELHDWKNLTKADIKEKVDAVVTTIHDGWVDPVEALIFAKKGIETFTALEKNVRGLAEAKGVGSTGLEKFNVKITEAMTGVKYDYSQCQDSEYNDMLDEMETLKANMKSREKFLIGLSKPMDIVVNDTEVITIHPPIKSGKLGLKVEMK